MRLGSKKQQGKQMENEEKSQQTEVSGEITVREAGRRGGCSTRDRYQGTGFYRRIGAKGGRATATRWRHLLSEFGRRGGRPRRPSLGENMAEEYPDEKGG